MNKDGCMDPPGLSMHPIGSRTGWFATPEDQDKIEAAAQSDNTNLAAAWRICTDSAILRGLPPLQGGHYEMSADGEYIEVTNNG
jgi:hypothetical protein